MAITEYIKQNEHPIYEQHKDLLIVYGPKSEEVQSHIAKVRMDNERLARMLTMDSEIHQLFTKRYL